MAGFCLYRGRREPIVTDETYRRSRAIFPKGRDVVDSRDQRLYYPMQYTSFGTVILADDETGNPRMVTPRDFQFFEVV